MGILLKIPIGTAFLKFISVGGIGFGCDLALTFLLKEKLKVNKYLSNSTGFMLGVTINYTLNRLWTFESHDPDIFMQYIKFATIGIIGLGLVNSIIYVLHDRFKIPFLPAKIMAMFVFMFWNFGANYFYTFNS